MNGYEDFQKEYFKRLRGVEKTTEVGQELQWMTWEEFERKTGPRVARAMLHGGSLVIRPNKLLQLGHGIEEPYCLEVCKVNDKFQWNKKNS